LIEIKFGLRLQPVYIDEAMQDAWIQSGAPGGEYIVKTHWSGFFGAWSATQEVAA
jgi:hypothetical protein